MILLDTNILSEPSRLNPNAAVLHWFASQPSIFLFTTSISIAELHHGVELLPLSRRRKALSEAVDTLVLQIFNGRILDFTLSDAPYFGRVKAIRAQAGRHINDADAMIAAVALRHSMTLATRNVRDFDGLGLDIVDPFNPSA